MSDKVIHVGENSPEQIAWRLLQAIASNEGKTTQTSMSGGATANRDWLLSTYAECIRVVRTGSHVK
jgi:hypothetical protein